MKQDSFGKYIEINIFISPVFDKEYVIRKYNNNWRKLHGLPVLRRTDKFRVEVIANEENRILKRVFGRD